MNVLTLRFEDHLHWVSATVYIRNCEDHQSPVSAPSLQHPQDISIPNMFVGFTPHILFLCIFSDEYIPKKLAEPPAFG